MRIAKETGATATIRDSVFLAEGYYRWGAVAPHGPRHAAIRREGARGGVDEIVGELPEVEVTQVPGGRPRRR